MATCGWCGRYHEGSTNFCSHECFEKFKAQKSYNGGDGSTDSTMDAAFDIVETGAIVAGAVLGKIFNPGAAKKKESKREIHETVSSSDTIAWALHQVSETATEKSMPIEHWYGVIDKIADEFQKELEEEASLHEAKDKEKAQELKLKCQKPFDKAVEKAKSKVEKYWPKRDKIGALTELRCIPHDLESVKIQQAYNFRAAFNESEFSLAIRAIKEMFGWRKK